MTPDPCRPATGMYPTGYPSSLTASDEARTFVADHIANERRVLELLSELSEQMDPLTAARAVFVPEQRSAQ